MKKILRLGAFAFLITATLVGCSSDGSADDILGGETPIIDENAEADEYGNPIDIDGNSIATVRLTEEGVEAIEPDKISTTIDGEAGGVVTGLVIFTSDTKQKRLYVTRTLPGESAMPFEIPALTNRGKKADDSIDLDGDSKQELQFAFDLDVPSAVEDGSIIYSFWSTTGKGDFRDPNKRLLLGVASIEVKVGDGISATDAAVRSFTGVQLFAPDSAGDTETFFSLLNGQAYKINVGPEFRFFWDFGYYYPGAAVGASFSSTSNYGTAFPFPVVGLSDETDAEETLNRMFFSESSLDFDNVTMSSDLDGITSSGVENIEGISEGDIIEFVDNYENKGLIKITGIQPGFGNEDYIQFDVKIQP